MTRPWVTIRRTGRLSWYVKRNDGAFAIALTHSGATRKARRLLARAERDLQWRREEETLT